MPAGGRGNGPYTNKGSKLEPVLARPSAAPKKATAAAPVKAPTPTKLQDRVEARPDLVRPSSKVFAGPGGRRGMILRDGTRVVEERPQSGPAASRTVRTTSIPVKTEDTPLTPATRSSRVMTSMPPARPIFPWSMGSVRGRGEAVRDFTDEGVRRNAEFSGRLPSRPDQIKPAPAAQRPAPAPQPTAAASGRTVQVNRGDTLWGISSRAGVPLKETLAANPQIKNPDRIFPGQSINVPASRSGGNASGIPSGPTLSKAGGNGNASGAPSTKTTTASVSRAAPSSAPTSSRPSPASSPSKATSNGGQKASDRSGGRW